MTDKEERVLDTLQYKLPVEEVTCMGAIECGFHTGCLSGTSEGDGVRISLDSGAGLGSPWLQVKIEREGFETRYFRSNMSDFLMSFCDNIDEENGWVEKENKD